MRRILFIFPFLLVVLGCKKDTEDLVFQTWGYEKNHAWIDLGLPSGTKWATCNVGASVYYDYGDYFAWGANYSNRSSYAQSGIYDISASSYDVAHTSWGGKWRMPTAIEAEELLNECTWKQTTQEGVNGYEVKGPNGNSIFMPAAGYYDGVHFYDNGNGVYWTSTPWGGSEAYYLDFNKKTVANLHRMYKFSIRPVMD